MTCVAGGTYYYVGTVCGLQLVEVVRRELGHSWRVCTSGREPCGGGLLYCTVLTTFDNTVREPEL